MKHAVKFFVLASSALLLAIVTLAPSGVKYQSVNAKTNTIAGQVLKADGSYPIPPFPKTGRSLSAAQPVLSADGSYPIPPFPKTGSLNIRPVLSADGSYPIPPFPKTGRSLSTVLEFTV